MPELQELPPVELEAAFDRLVTVFGESPKQRRAGWVWALREKTKHWSTLELRVAVKDAAADCRFFPRPADVLKRRPPRVTEAEQVAPSTRDVCRGCRKHFFYAGYRTAAGTIVPRLRCACRQGGAGWDDPEARAWREPDAELVAAGYSTKDPVLRFPR